jgi:hypothetical protein
MKSVALICLALSSTSSFALPLTGTLSKDHSTAALSFDLVAGDERLAYHVDGSTTAMPQFSLLYSRDLDFSGVRVAKIDYSTGAPQIQAYHNSGVIHFDAVLRTFNNLSLAGFGFSGTYSEGLFDHDLDFSGITGGGAASRGMLDYTLMVAEYYPTGGARFGASTITARGSAPVINFDHFVGQNLLTFNMGFGNLIVTGTIQFSEMGTSATRGQVNLNITKSDGSDVVLSSLSESEDHSELELRAFIAFLEMMSHDLVSN